MDSQNKNKATTTETTTTRRLLPPTIELGAVAGVVIGIDPGCKTSGVVSMAYGPSGYKIHFAEAEVDNWQVRRALYDLREQSRAENKTLEDVFICMEMVACYGMAVGRETFETVRWLGRFEEVIAGYVNYQAMYRMSVKMALCGHSRAKDENVRARLIDIFGPKGTKKNPGLLFPVAGHSWAALALVTTHLIENKLLSVPELVSA